MLCKKPSKKFEKTKKVERFISPYRPPRNVHSLPKEKRLVEYRKALRALNEKICWLTEKQYQAENRANKEEVLLYQQQIQETEFRKIKCLIAIEHSRKIEKRGIMSQLHKIPEKRKSAILKTDAKLRIYYVNQY